ncbi:Dyp-type peroxidase [Streptantibioticus rubrisoli]|uniref:Dyp-type peroxidase n=1 Tax=Streptantibioticus rubrisoli TaxID=1387313 RepID=A0ABT1PEL9_9ACTN|nr:Dyp-type peroxidase [Streptantibioticus rubrisoli]MCQ4043823.1 Dyp-type peroxidase [Streptantibioticus rubrisoli]
MSEGKGSALADGWGGGGCPVGLFARRSVLQGTAAGLVGAAGGNLIGGDSAVAQSAGGGDRTTGKLIPFHGYHQAGIATPPQTVGAFSAFEVTASNRAELIELFRILTARIRLLTSGRTEPNAPDAPPADNGILGPGVVRDDLTITVAVGATLFDERYGLHARKPVQLKTMTPFLHDDLDPTISQGDLLLQVCAGHRDTTVHAMLDILSHTKGLMKLRWRFHCQRNPPRPTGIPRDWFGFKDGITNPDTTNTAQMDKLVWVQPNTAEPAWAAGGTYQAVRIVHFFLEAWQKVPVAQQERIFGRRKISGAPLYAVSDDAPDTFDPIYTNDPQGLITPLNCHVRLANPQTPQTASTSSILRRSYDYERSPDMDGRPDLGHVFCCFQRELNTYIAMQTRLEAEALVPYITPRGGGYFFALPGVRDHRDHLARTLLT